MLLIDLFHVILIQTAQLYVSPSFIQQAAFSKRPLDIIHRPTFQKEVNFHLSLTFFTGLSLCSNLTENVV